MLNLFAVPDFKFSLIGIEIYHLNAEQLNSKIRFLGWVLIATLKTNISLTVGGFKLLDFDDLKSAIFWQAPDPARLYRQIYWDCRDAALEYFLWQDR